MKRDLAIAEKQTHPGKEKYLLSLLWFQGARATSYAPMVNLWVRHSRVIKLNSDASVFVMDDRYG